MAEDTVVKVVVTIEAREDGGLYVYSNDLPGFVLSHIDAHAVLEDIEPALSTFLSQKLGSGLIDHSQKMTMAAMQIADMNV